MPFRFPLNFCLLLIRLGFDLREVLCLASKKECVIYRKIMLSTIIAKKLSYWAWLIDLAWMASISSIADHVFMQTI